MRKMLMRVALIGALLATVASAAPAMARGNNDVIRRGACSGSSDWKLKLSPEDGRLEVEFEVDSNVNGQTWRVRIFHDDTRIFAGRRMTRAPSGSFEVRTLAANHMGTDHFRARARNLANDEVCVGRASI